MSLDSSPKEVDPRLTKDNVFYVEYDDEKKGSLDVAVRNLVQQPVEIPDSVKVGSEFDDACKYFEEQEVGVTHVELDAQPHALQELFSDSRGVLLQMKSGTFAALQSGGGWLLFDRQFPTFKNAHSFSDYLTGVLQSNGRVALLEPSEFLFPFRREHGLSSNVPKGRYYAIDDSFYQACGRLETDIIKPFQFSPHELKLRQAAYKVSTRMTIFVAVRHSPSPHIICVVPDKTTVKTPIPESCDGFPVKRISQAEFDALCTWGPKERPKTHRLFGCCFPSK